MKLTSSVISLVLFIGVFSCKSTKNAAQPTTYDSSSNSGGYQPTNTNKRTPEEIAKRIGELMDEQATELKRYLKNAEVERTKDGIQVNFDPQVYFDTNADDLTQTAKENIENMGRVLVKYPYTNILVEGHTDSTGRKSFNQKLSQKRAYSFADYSIKQGINANRVQTIGYGSDRPKASNKTPEGRQMNRRISAMITVNEEMYRRIADGEL